MVTKILVMITVQAANPWVQSFIGLRKICHHDNLLVLVGFYTFGLSWPKYVCCQVTAAGHAANSCDFPAAFLVQSVSFFLLSMSEVS
jgi:hypothetical protein